MESKNDDLEKKMDLNFQKNLYNYNLRKAKIMKKLLLPILIGVVLLTLMPILLAQIVSK